VLLDRDQLLLPDEAVPYAERLRVDRRVGVVLGHVATHDVGGVLSDLEARLEPVLEAHACDVLGVDGVPGRSVLFLQSRDRLDGVGVGSHCLSFVVVVRCRVCGEAVGVDTTVRQEPMLFRRSDV
jgi:hypothetical protein